MHCVNNFEAQSERLIWTGGTAGTTAEFWQSAAKTFLFLNGAVLIDVAGT
jgi:hypothetical protein